MRWVVMIGMLGAVVANIGRVAWAQGSATVAAEAVSRQPINVTTVHVLSYLPVNGPALIVAKKPVWGAVVSVWEAGMLTLGTVGAIELIKGENCTPGEFLCGFGTALAATATATGYAAWSIPYVITAIRALKLAEEYNSLVARQPLQPVPTVWVSHQGGGIGMAGRF